MPDTIDWKPAGVDVNVPSVARIYDYSLGGAHNFAADRETAEALYAVLPEGRLVGRSNRAFLQRAVRYCCEQGIRQFLDLGSGIPTVGNVHEIAHQYDPEIRVVYVDNEAVAVAHTQDILTGVTNAGVVCADMRDVDTVLSAPETQRLIDFGQPLAVMMVAVLHYVSHTDDAPAIVRRYVERLVPGSFLAISHTTYDPRPEVAAKIKALFDQTDTPVTHRTREEVEALFGRAELVEPGVVWTPQWHPVDESEPLRDNPAMSATFAGLARVPEPHSRRGTPGA